jgi:hypothetical protein
VGGDLAWEGVVTKGMQVGESTPATFGGSTPNAWGAIGINETGAMKQLPGDGRLRLAIAVFLRRVELAKSPETRAVVART